MGWVESFPALCIHHVPLSPGAQLSDNWWCFHFLSVLCYCFHWTFHFFLLRFTVRNLCILKIKCVKSRSNHRIKHEIHRYVIIGSRYIIPLKYPVVHFKIVRARPWLLFFNDIILHVLIRQLNKLFDSFFHI